MSETEHTFEGQPRDYWLRVRMSGCDEDRWQAVDAIRHICDPDTSIPLFLDTIRNDTYWRARALAAHALHDLTYFDEDRPRIVVLIPFLIETLGDESHCVREQIIETLENLGGAATVAIPALESIAEGVDAELAQAAKSAIQSIRG